MAISKRLRFEILRRDNYTCRYCGASAPDATLTVDHVVAVALGGSDEASNLVTACRDCNSGKSATPADAATVADVAADALRWARAMGIARIRAMQEHEQQEAWCEEFYDHWSGFTVTVPTYKRGSGRPEPIPLPRDWRTTITGLAADGMYAAEMRDAINIAMARNPDDRFSYFVGIIRNRLRERQEAARGIIERGEA